MKIGNAIINKRFQAVVLTNYGILPISELDCYKDKNTVITTDDVIRNTEISNSVIESLHRTDYKDKLTLSNVKWASVVNSPQKIICVGLNYKNHVSETHHVTPNTPILFGKYTNSLAGSGEEIVIPKETKQLDYEGELGIVVGKKGKNINESEAIEHIFGYFVGNDISARDLQFRTSQWMIGKTCDGFFPCGPFIATRDEIKDPQKLSLVTKLNGEIRQNSNTSNMIFPIAFLISYISKFMTIYPGDLISTGTPEGVIQGMSEDERVWLSSGDKVSVEIAGIGSLENTFK